MSPLSYPVLPISRANVNESTKNVLYFLKFLQASALSAFWI